MADRKEETIELSIVTINYQTDDLIIQLLEKLTPHFGVEIIIIDNSPTDSLGKKLPQRSDVKYFFTGKNLGFSGGSNLGLTKARGEWILYLNSDTIVSTKDAFDLIHSTKDRKFLVAAPKLVQPDSKIQNNVGFFDSLFVNPLNFSFRQA